jgi:hypothetical protein
LERGVRVAVNNNIGNQLKTDGLRITEIFDEKTQEYTKVGIEFQQGFIEIESAGKSRMGLELAFKALEMIEAIELETGLSIEEIRYLKNREDMD